MARLTETKFSKTPTKVETPSAVRVTATVPATTETHAAPAAEARPEPVAPIITAATAPTEARHEPVTPFVAPAATATEPRHETVTPTIAPTPTPGEARHEPERPVEARPVTPSPVVPTQAVAAHAVQLVDKGSYALAAFQPGPDTLELKPGKLVEVTNFTMDDHIVLDGARYKTMRYSFSDKSGAPVGELSLADASGHLLQSFKFDGRYKGTDFSVVNTDKGVVIGLLHPAATSPWQSLETSHGSGVSLVGAAAQPAHTDAVGHI